MKFTYASFHWRGHFEPFRHDHVNGKYQSGVFPGLCIAGARKRLAMAKASDRYWSNISKFSQNPLVLAENTPSFDMERHLQRQLPKGYVLGTRIEGLN